MRQLFVTAVGGIAFWLVITTTTSADPEACRDAIDEYNSARSDIADNLKRYASCVADSDGHDDCSSEFESLKSAQDDFESAVSSYESECECECE